MWIYCKNSICIQVKLETASASTQIAQRTLANPTKKRKIEKMLQDARDDPTKEAVQKEKLREMLKEEVKRMPDLTKKQVMDSVCFIIIFLVQWPLLNFTYQFHIFEL